MNLWRLTRPMCCFDWRRLEAHPPPRTSSCHCQYAPAAEPWTVETTAPSPGQSSTVRTWGSTASAWGPNTAWRTADTFGSRLIEPLRWSHSRLLCYGPPCRFQSAARENSGNEGTGGTQFVGMADVQESITSGAKLKPRRTTRTRIGDFIQVSGRKVIPK